MSDTLASLIIAIDSSRAKSAAVDLDHLSAAGEKTKESMAGIADAGRKSADGMSRVVGVGRQAADSTQRLATASSGAARGMAEVTRAAREQATAVGNVGSVIGRYVGILGATFGANAMLQAADAWGQVNSRLKLATQSSEEFLYVQAELARIADLTYSNFNSLADGFANSTRNLRQLGLVTRDQLAIQESLLSASIVSGASDEQRTRILDAFNKALATGILRGDEWNTINTNGARIVGLLADEMGKTELQVAQMARNGGIAIDTMLKALINGAPRVSEEVEKMPVSFADAMTRLGNSFQRFVGTADDTYRISQRITQAIDWLSANFANVARAATLLAATALPALISQLRALAVVIAANPIGALATAALAAAAAITAFSGSIQIAADSHATLADLAAEAWSSVGELARNAAAAVAVAWSSTVDDAETSATDFELTWADAFVNIARSADAIGAAMIGTVAGIGAAFGNLGRWIDAMFARVFNAVTERAERFTNQLIEMSNAARNVVGMAQLPTVQFARRDDDGTKFDPLGSFMAEWESAMQGDFYERRAEDVIRRANDRALARTKSVTSAAAGGVSNIRISQSGKSDEQKLAESTEKYADALQRQLDATYDLTAAERVLYDLRQGRIAEGPAFDRALDLAKQIDAAKQRIQQEQSQLALIEAQSAAQRDLNELTAQYAREIEGLGRGQRSREHDAGLNRIDDRFADQRRDLKSSRTGLELEGKWTESAQAQYDRHLEIIDSHHAQAVAAFENYWTELAEKEGNFFVGASEAMANYIDDARNVAQQSEELFTNAFKGMEDALVQFAMTGKSNFKDLANSIIADLLRIQIRAALSNIMGSSGNWLGALFGAIGSAVGVGAKPSTPPSTPPSNSGFSGPRYATGTPFVPNDQVALLHKGEAVVPASMNPWAGGRSPFGGGASFSFGPTIINGDGMSPAQIDAIVQHRNAELEGRIFENIARGRWNQALRKSAA